MGLGDCNFRQANAPTRKSKQKKENKRTTGVC